MYPTPQRPDWGVFVYDQVESLRALGVDVELLAFDAAGRARAYLLAAREMRRMLRRRGRRVDVIHAHYGLCGVVARMQVGLPVIVTFHGNDLVAPVDDSGRPTFHARREALLGKLAAWGATRCIVVAERLKPLIRPRQAVTIPMGVDLDTFKPMPRDVACRKLGLAEDRKRVVFVARPDNFIKRFDRAEAAVARLREQGWDVELLPVYGVAHDRVPLYLNASDAMVLTSLQEASPMIVKEALACNLPVVATDVGDTAERLRGVSNCALCTMEPDDIAAKLASVLSGGERSNGREAVESLSLPNVAQRVLAVYREVLGDKAI
jgi:glycosyltransferase involved in cell wall biosynthesis